MAEALPEERRRPVELLRALGAYLAPPEPGHSALARALGLGEAPTPSDYADALLFELHPYASVHMGPEGMLGGVVRERIAGFWRAVGRVVPAEPDHLGPLLALYAGLCDEGEAAGPAETKIVETAASALLHEHLTGWVFEYLTQLSGRGGPYGAWAELTHETLTEEVRRGGLPCALPIHLAEAPTLPDPRIDGGPAFMIGLLAPVRTGTLVTRGSLARLARELDLGLRAGERRWALEHLLAQAAPEVLAVLAEEAEAAACRHAGRKEVLGVIAGFGEERALRTARLLRDLASEGAAAVRAVGAVRA